MANDDDLKMIDALRSLIDYVESQHFDAARSSLIRMLEEVTVEIGRSGETLNIPLGNVVKVPTGGVGGGFRKIARS